MTDLSLALQTVQFLQSIVLGAALSILYDVFYIIRSFFPRRIGPLMLLDLLYFLMCGVLLFEYLLQQNNGRMRYFIFLGVVIGWVVFHITLSRIIVKIIDFILKWLRKILLWLMQPIISVYRFLRRRMELPMLRINKAIQGKKLGLKRKAHLLYNKANQAAGGVLRGKKDKPEPHE